LLLHFLRAVTLDVVGGTKQNLPGDVRQALQMHRLPRFLQRPIFILHSAADPAGWPSARRGTGALPPAHVDMDERVKPIEQHGFIIADFSADKIVLRMFKWDVKTQRGDAIDTLKPFHTAELTRAG
jgi:hypothetical protein